MKERLYSYDFIRAVSALAVIAIHTTSGYVLSNQWGFAWNQSMRFAVPMFVILSGLLLFHSDQDIQSFSPVSFFKKRIDKILVPYFLWTIIYMVYEHRHQLNTFASSTTLFEFAKNISFGIGHLYFVVIILQLYILYPLLRFGFKRGYFAIILILSFTITFYFQLAMYLTRWDILILPQRLFAYAYLLFPSWIFYFVLGMALSIKGSFWQKKCCKHAIPLVIFWVCSLIVLVIESRKTGTFESSVKPSVIVYSAATFFLLYLISQYLPKIQLLEKLITWSSRQSFCIFLSHVLLLSLIRSLFSMTGCKVVLSSTIGMVLFYLATVIATYIFTFLLSITPFATVLGGSRSK